MAQRHGVQFHFENRAYEAFDDFLNALSARKRKNIKKERMAAADSAHSIRILSGDDLKTHHFDAFMLLYGYFRSQMGPGLFEPRTSLI